MPSLSEAQSDFRDAVAGGSAAALMPLLRAPAEVADRLAIYRRHHREGFRRHLRGRYPTLEWLLGTDATVALADLTLQHAPPRAPSLAEYGAEMIATVTSRGDDLPPYAADVARVDWHLGCVSVAVAPDPLALGALASVDQDHLSGLRMTLQPGLAFLKTGWPVDDLVHLRLRDSQPDELSFAPRDTFLQLRGARGQFTLQKLAPGPFAFRSRLAAGKTLVTAAEAGATAQPAFDLPAALAALFAEGLVTSLHPEISHA